MTWVRWSIGFCYLWFGALKFFPGLSPAETLAADTVKALTLGMIDGRLAVVLLGSMECVIGLALFIGRGMRPALHLLLVHMVCTFAPVFLFPHLVFSHVPYGLTLVGQYIMKNLVIASTAWLLLGNTSQRT